MSWWSDREKFDEYEPDFCKWCPGGTSKADCDRCKRDHYEPGWEEYEVEDATD